MVESRLEVPRESIVAIAFKFAILFMFLQSMYAWFTWTLHPVTSSVVTICICLLYVKVNPYKFELNKRLIYLILLLVISRLYCSDGTGLYEYIRPLLSVIPVAFVLCLNQIQKRHLLGFLTKSFAFILIISLLFWIILLLGVQLPKAGTISHPSWEMYVYDNYLFVLRNNLLYDIRFSSIFLEPGHLGMISSFLLFANRFELKRKEVLVIFIATLFTLSLAAYVLVLVAYSAHVFVYSNRRTAYFLSWFCCLTVGYLFFTTWNNGNNIVNELIISRLEYDSTEGDFSGNNRFSQMMDDYFSKFIISDQAWFGIGSERYLKMDFGPNAGYKVFILQYGLIGTLLVSWLYLSFLPRNSSKQAKVLLVLYALAFIQRSYPFWACELLIFITAMASVSSQKNFTPNALSENQPPSSNLEVRNR